MDIKKFRSNCLLYTKEMEVSELKAIRGGGKVREQWGDRREERRVDKWVIDGGGKYAELGSKKKKDNLWNEYWFCFDL